MTGQMTATLAERAIQAVDWTELELASGPARGFGESLTAFISRDSAVPRDQLWQSMENKVFVQDDVYSAAEPTIRVLLAALAEPRPDDVRNGALDLLFLLVHAASFRGDELGQRCVSAAAEGGWLLVREAMAGRTGVRDSCLEILDICAPDCARAVRMMP